MAWNIPELSVPVIRPVAPEVPSPDNVAAKIISAGTGSAVEGFTRMAIARENARIEQEQKLRNADLAAKGLQLREQDMAHDYELKKMLYGSYQTNAGANATRAQSALERLMQQNKDRGEFEGQIAKLNSDVDARAKELGLTNPELQTKNPLGFAAGLQKIRGEFPNAPLYTGIPDRFKAWQAVADQQTIPVKYGAVYDEDKKVWRGGETKVKPIWQVYRDLHNPDTQQTTIDALAAIGHLNTQPSGTIPISGTLKKTKWYERSSFSADVPQTTTTWDGVVANIIKQGDQADWTPGVSRMPTFVPKSTRGEAVKFGDQVYDSRTTAAGRADQGSIDQTVDAVGNEAPLPAPDLPPDSNLSGAAPPDEPTQSDVLLQQARRAASMPGADIEGIKGVLRQNGIDPGQL